MNDIQYAFFNEYGDYGFDFDNIDTSTHFMITAILVKDSDKECLEEEIEKILEKYFQNKDYGFSQIKNQPDLLLKILIELNELPLKIYTYAIDKQKIRENSGVTYKNTFIKYLTLNVLEDLSNTYEKLDIVADDKEPKEFMKAFLNYVKKECIPDLFNYSSFGFNNTKSDILVNLAEWIAGTLAMEYDRKHSKHYQTFYKLIKPQIVRMNLWPHDYRNFLYDYKVDRANIKNDEVIIKQAVNSAYQYIDKYRKTDDEDEKLRVDFIKFLLFNLKENPDDYVYTQEILNNLNAIREVDLNPHNFRSSIVSKLRDRGLLIASSNKGYKLPVCLADLYDFVNLSSLTIFPMIQRIAKCRDQILKATNKEVDILEQKEYEYLKRVIDMEKVK
ncbi:hypothetical protein BIV60_05870 [Bacillus sp. MUM 116]|uniref:DUF3800 domain-containing protein n=1 Tax=Bacillus sp. MUM 116 TaxID=1678002 RepID=UPI0008F5E453|nr:DUF3800 domain-containing protein [Bacillus sp. MUM 116]OIK16166.1 hypothetical protein BIV60_05870 [Bacillus sp. MUM 116]